MTHRYMITIDEVCTGRHTGYVDILHLSDKHPPRWHLIDYEAIEPQTPEKTQEAIERVLQRFQLRSLGIHDA